MADQTITSPPATGTARIGTEDCPHVADLINYALGRCLNEERRRVEAHLGAGTCSACQGWVERAGRFRDEPAPDAATDSLAGALRAAPAPPPTSDPTPIPSSSQWQRRVFRDLEDRLQRLDD